MTEKISLRQIDFLKYLPHRAPFLFIDEVSHLVIGHKITATKVITVNDDVFRGHFPGNPIMPGALIQEALAQASCVLYAASLQTQHDRVYYLSAVKLRFLKPVSPPCCIQLTSVAVKMISSGGIFQVEAKVSSESVAVGEMVFACRHLIK